ERGPPVRSRSASGRTTLSCAGRRTRGPSTTDRRSVDCGPEVCAALRPQDVAEQVGLPFDWLEMRESFAVAIVDVKHAGERSLFDVDLQRLPGADLFAKHTGVVLAAVDRVDLHAGDESRVVCRRAGDGVRDRAIAL